MDIPRKRRRGRPNLRGKDACKREITNRATWRKKINSYTLRPQMTGQARDEDIVTLFNLPSMTSIVSCGSFSPCSSFLSGTGCWVTDGWEAPLSWDRSESIAPQCGARLNVARASSAADVVAMLKPDIIFAFLSATIRFEQVEYVSLISWTEKITNED